MSVFYCWPLLAEDDVTFEEELMEETPPPGDYMEEGEEAKEFGFVDDFPSWEII